MQIAEDTTTASPSILSIKFIAFIINIIQIVETIKFKELSNSTPISDSKFIKIFKLYRGM